MTCSVGDEEVWLPDDADVLLASHEPFVGLVESDVCVWWRRGR